MKINKKLLMAALASAVIVSAPQVKTYADTQANDTQAVTEKLIDDQIASAAQPAEQSNSEKVNAEGKQSQQESSELKSEKEIESDKSISKSQALSHPAQATALRSVGNESDNSVLTLSEEKIPAAQGAGETSTQKETVPNYSEDEKKIQDYGKERYRQTDLQPGKVNQDLNKTDEKKEKDGFKFETKNPSAESKSKTEYGYQITIDKKTGQRTYTKIYVTDSGRVLANTGDKSMMEQGDKLTPESPDVTYKPNESGEITNAGRQKNYNYEASEDTLKHINNKENDSTSFGMKDNYTKENPQHKFFEGDSFVVGYRVNPWPNENDKLQELKLNKNNYDSNKKYFVQGQDIDTGIKVDNMDANARERLVGQVYNPITGKVIEGAKAYIDENGKVKIKMPAGAVNEDGTINKDSDFYKNPELRGLTSFDVKFFARPRTKGEFENIANTGDEFSKGTYVGTGAGSGTINHKGQDVTIDKQGIDRYDHYNLIGDFSLQLDDTRYYDQDFIDQNNKPTKDNMTSNIRPGTEFQVEMFTPSNPTEHQKTGDEMNEALKKGQASGKLDTQFLDKENRKIAEKLGVKYEDFIAKDEYKEKRWNLVTSKTDIAKFKIVAPKNAKGGDFVALSVEYTYTNGSKDVQKFIFVVKDSTYIRPEYDSSVDFPTEEQTSKAKVVEDDKKTPPNSYSLPDTLENDKANAGNKIVKDDKGNRWSVSIDKDTGKVTAKPLAGGKFNGGEKLQVPVVAHYVDKDEPGKDITEETVAEFYIKEKANMTARYNAKAGKAGDKLSSDVILNEVDKYNRRPSKYTLESNTFTDDKGNVWNVTIDENTGKVTATVPNAAEGKSIDGALLNVPVTAHYYDTDGTEKGTRKTEVQFVAYGTNGKVEKTEEIPFDTIVKKDPNLKKGEIKVITEGEKGSKKVTYTIEDSKVTDTKEEELKAPQTREIHVGEGVNDGTHKIEEKVEVGFETEIQFDDSLAPGETKEIQKGEAGEKKRDITLTIEDGKVTKTENGEFTETKAPKKRIIKVGRNTEGKVEHKEELPFKYKVEEVDTLKKGEYKIVKPGKVGTKTTTWTIKNSKVDGEPTVTEVAAEDALIQVGKGTNEGTHEIKEKKELPFETRIEYDENLEAGQREETGGEPGEQERTNTLVIKDGKVTETKEGEFKTTKKPVDKVIKIGIKPIVKEVEKPFETEYIYDENVEMGKEEEVKPGEKGKVTITTSYDKEQNKLVTKEETKDPVKRVVKVGIKPVVKEEPIPQGKNYTHNPNLKDGEIVEKSKGTPGKVIITTTFNKETGKIETKVERTEPKDAEYEYGSKTEGKVKVESDLPFEVEIIKDPEMEAGKTETVQEGKLGKKETTITVENSKEVSREEKVITEPVKKIVKVGTKNVCEIPPVKPEDPTKPGDKDPENPTKPGDKDPENPTKPEDPKNPEKPGEKDPEKPGTPGEKPNEPGTPGEKPNEPSTPGEKPNEPGTPGKTPEENGKTPEENGKTPEENGKTPEENGKKPEENGKTPENNGKTPENNGKTPENNGKTPDNSRGDSPNKPHETTEQGKRKEKADTPNRRSANKLPKAGSESEIMMLSMSALMTAAGFIGLKKKRKDK